MAGERNLARHLMLNLFSTVKNNLWVAPRVPPRRFSFLTMGERDLTPARLAGTLALQGNPLDCLNVVFWRASVLASRSHGCETGTE
jgi:hypothetical protein